MVYLYSGTPGSGKSLHMAKNLFYYLNCHKEYLVICNFEIDLSNVKHPERFVYMDNTSLLNPFDDLEPLIVEYFSSGLFRRVEGSIKVFIDECQLLFNSRDWKMEGRKEWLAFFTMHRKYFCDVYLVAQYDEMIDKQVRALIEYEVVHRKVSNMGYIGWFLKLLTFGDWFVAVERFYSLKMKVDAYYFRAWKKYYSLYDTFKIFGETNNVSSP